MDIYIFGVPGAKTEFIKKEKLGKRLNDYYYKKFSNQDKDFRLPALMLIQDIKILLDNYTTNQIYDYINKQNTLIEFKKNSEAYNFMLVSIEIQNKVIKDILKIIKEIEKEK
jgi:hypothetical protein